MTDTPSLWRYYDTYFRGAYRKLFLSLPLTVAQALTVVPITAIVSHAFDSIIPSGDVQTLALVGGAILALYLTNLGLTLLSRLLILRATKRAILGLRLDLIRLCFERSWSWFRGRDTSRLHHAIVQDTEFVDVMTYSLFGVVLPEILIGVALVVVLLTIDPYLLGMLVLVVPILVILGRYLAWRARIQTLAFRASNERFGTSVAMALRHMELTRTQGAESVEIARQATRVDELCSVSGHMAWLYSAHGAVQRTTLASAGVLVLIAGGQSVAAGTLSLGQLLAFSVATALLVTHVSTGIAALPPVLIGFESLRSLAGLWQATDAPPYSGRRAPKFRGRVRVESVWFQYGTQPLLRGVDLTLPSGSTVALVGENGTGKSTLLQLMLGLYRPDQGRLYADDHAYADIDLVQLRHAIGVVPQDPQIFPGTVFENLTYGLPDAGHERVERAARAALADAFVAGLPDGYQTLVGEGGVSLSGGQRQRLAIARALVRDPVLLVLDEPGNHLDRATVQRVLENLRMEHRRPTTLIITHDEDIVATCDAVYLLEDGQIVPRRRLAAAGTTTDLRRVQ